jgi:diguanylate cyclase (GGDEF)-like protein
VTGAHPGPPGYFEILVVDDHEGTRDSLVDILTSAGFPARAAPTARGALMLQADTPAAVAVVDYQLPDATGLELAARLKDQDADLPVIVLTGNASLETAVAAVALVDDYLTKPVSAEAFLRAVRAAVMRRRLVLENRQLLVRLQEANATLEATVRQRTREVRADRERLAEAQRIARIGSWEWDLQTEVLTSSAELRRLIGFEEGPQPATPDELLAHVLPEDRPLAQRAAAEAVESIGPFGFEVRAQPPGEELRWLAVRGRVETDKSGTPVRLVGTCQDVTDSKRAEEQSGTLMAELAHQALHDALTGLPNRALLLDRLDQALAQSERTGSAVAVLFLDLDRFKLVNDSRGHAAGDQLLVRVAERLRQVVRPADTVARFGGDEFVVICQDAGVVGHAMHVADRVADAFRSPFPLGADDMFLNVSIGIATSDGRTSPAELLRNADAAMYQAKELGRGRCEFFDETMRTEAAARLDLQTALHWAITRQEMQVYYQPVVNLRTGVPVGVEALARWAHPTKGIVGPADFVKLAEEAGLIVPIDVSVLQQATMQCARWPAGPSGIALNVSANLSIHHLRHPDLLDHVRSVLDRSGLDPSSLCLELTESVLLEDVDRHMRTLLELRALGVRLAIDDFGTGFSSLTYLKRFPVDAVKIDRSFVAGLGTDVSDTAIVRSVIDLAHALSLQVVAEGVEQPEQLDALQSLGCDVAQGYLFAPPLPTEDLLPWLAGHRPCAAQRPAARVL